MDQAWYSRPWEIWGFDPDWHSHRPGRTGSIETGCSRAPDHLLHWRKITMPMHCRWGDDCDAGKPWEGNAPDCSPRSEEHTSELQSLRHLVCRLLLEKKK